jgi:hypothetical protein
VPNANTVRRQVYGTQQLTLAAITNPGTTETQFQLNNNALTGLGGGVVPLQVGNFGVYAGTGQIIHVRANGTYSGVTGASTTLLLTLYEVPAAIIAAGGLTPTSNTNYNSVAASAATTLGTGDGNFSFDAYLQIDSNGTLSGSFESAINGVTVGPAHSTTVTGLVGEADLNFVLSAKLGTAEPAASTLILNEFAIDVS